MNLSNNTKKKKSQLRDVPNFQEANRRPFQPLSTHLNGQN